MLAILRATDSPNDRRGYHTSVSHCPTGTDRRMGPLGEGLPGVLLE